MLNKLDELLVHRYSCSVLGARCKAKFLINRLARKIARHFGKHIDPLRRPFDLIGGCIFVSYDGLLFEGFDHGLRICIYPHEIHYLEWTRRILEKFGEGARRHDYVNVFNVLDVGAHIGSYAIRVARYMKELGINGFVIAVEPDPRNAMYLLKNAILNGVEDRIVLLNLCARNVSCVSRFYIYDRSDRGSLSFRTDSRFVRTMKRICTRIDEVVRLPIHIMKIDVEGAEFDVVRGATELIARYRPTIFVEIHRGVPTLEEIEQFLKPYGYRIREMKIDRHDPRHIHTWLDTV